MGLKGYKGLIFFKLILSLIVIYIFFSYYNNEKKIIDYKNRSNSIVFIMDVSKSMDESDVTNKYGINISRLDLEKLFVKKMLDIVDSGVLIGIITFARFGKRYIPPTNDIESLILYLDSLNTNLFPQGSNIITGLKKFIFYSLTGDVGIVLSDFHFDYDKRKYLIQLKEKLERKNLQLYFLKIGNGSLNVCEQLAKIFDSKCFVVNGYRDFQKIDIYKILKKKFNKHYHIDQIFKDEVLSLFSL